MMGEGRNVGGEFGRVVVDAGARGQQAGHERGARGRAERARAIGAFEHHAGLCERIDVRRLDDAMAVGGQERGRQLIDQYDENVRLVWGHAGSGYLAARRRVHSVSIAADTRGSWAPSGHKCFNVSSWPAISALTTPAAWAFI